MTLAREDDEIATPAFAVGYGGLAMTTEGVLRTARNDTVEGSPTMTRCGSPSTMSFRGVRRTADDEESRLRAIVRP